MKKLLAFVFLFIITIPTYASVPELVTEDVRSLLNERSYFVEEFLQPGLSIEDMIPEEDKHADFLTPEEREEYMQKLIGKFSGIGIQIEDADKDDDENNYIRILRTIREGPAVDKLQKDDIIVGVNGVNIQRMEMKKSVKLMKGEKGSKVVLTIMRDGESLDVTIIRDIVIMESIFSIILTNEDDEDEILYLRVEQFSEGLAIDFYNYLNNDINENTKGIIIDLRYNPGGLLDEAARVLDLFIYEGLLVETKDKNNNLISAFNAHPFIITGVKIVVLINEFSASAAEVVASGLRDHQVALLVGTKSYGKGSVQTIFPLPGKYMVKFTTARYFTASGFVIDGVGLTPDIIVDLDEDEVPTFNLDEVEEFDTQILKALSLF